MDGDAGDVFFQKRVARVAEQESHDSSKQVYPTLWDWISPEQRNWF